MELERAIAKSWFVRTAEGAVYGPATFVELLGWAAEARIVPGSTISEDRQKWAPAEQIPELGMEWYADLGDGEKVGPLHLYAICDLIGDGSIGAGTAISNPKRSITIAAGDMLFKYVAETARRELAAFAVNAADWGRDALKHAAEVDHARVEFERQLAILQSHIADQKTRHAADSTSKDKSVDEIKARMEKEALALKARIAEADKEFRGLQEKLKVAQTALDQAASAHAKEREQYEARQSELGADLCIRKEQLRQAQEQGEAERRKAAARQAELVAELEDVKQRLLSEKPLLEEKAARLLQTERDMQRFVDELRVRDEQLRIAHEQIETERRKETARQTELDFLRQTVAQREAQLKEQDGAHESAVGAARQNVAELQAKLAAQRKAAEEESRQARDTVENLQREVVRLQKECAGTAAMLARTVAELEKHTGKRQHAAHIDWVAAGQSAGVAEQTSVGAVQPVQPGSPEEAAALREQIRTLTVLYGRAEQQLEEQKDQHAASLKEHGDREKLLNALIDQLKRDIEASSRVVQQTMQEIERRELEFRNQRRQGEQREAELRGRIVELERLVSDSAGRTVPPEQVVPEVLPPEPSADEAAESERPHEPTNILAGLEAQAQAEIEAWHRNISHETEAGPATRIKNWLKRKQQ